ncbi:SAGA-associated factor 29 homolog A-like isoform X4 [Carex rostrata]
MTTSGEIGVILEKAKELDQVRKELDDTCLEINKLHKKISSSPEMVEKSLDAVLTKLRSLYGHAKDLSESEASVTNVLVNMLDGLTPSGLSVVTRKKSEVNEPKKKRKMDTDTSRFTAPSIRSQLDQAASLKGEQQFQVAARVTPDNAEKDEWFIVKVTHFDRDTKEFEVLDEEPGDDEETMQKKYSLPMTQIIPFPKKSDPSSAPEFSQGQQVLAVYPGTTALYKATVVNSHRKKSDDYVLEFDDDEEDGSLPQRSVPFFKVVPLPVGHRQ